MGDLSQAHIKAVPPLQRLSDKERLTLADYLSFHIHACQSSYRNPVSTPRTLPKDGRDLALDNCQGCHIITVVVTQDNQDALDRDHGHAESPGHQDHS